MKTIIQVWTHRCCNTTESNFWGLGDMLRGTLLLYQYTKNKNYNFILDYQLHEISKFLKNNNHEYSDIIKNNYNNINFISWGNIENYINSNNNDIVYFFTNGLIEGANNIENDVKEFIKNILIPNDLFQIYIDNILKNIPYNFYNILHYRLGDELLINNNNNNNIINIVDNVNKNIENNDILISDSIFFKEYIKKELPNIFMLNIKPCHIGFSKEEDLLKDTFLEFILITKSQKIKTYSKYCWISGFVYWAHKIYDIPLEKI